MIRRWLDGVRQDVAFGLRSFRRRPGLAAIAVGTLAVGIGATTAVFSVVDAVLLEPLPYRAPHRLVTIWHRFTALGGERTRVAAPDVAEYRDGAESFEGIAWIRRAEERALERDGGGVHVRVGVVTPDLFSLLGVEAARGRTFLPGEGVLAAVPAAGDTTGPDEAAPPPPPGPLVLGHSLWQTAFGADPEVIGRTVRLSGVAWEVVGVLPEDFELVLPPGSGLPEDIRAWTTLSTPLEAFERATGLRDQDSDNTGIVIGRLAADASLERAREELESIASRQRDASAFYRDAGLRVEVEGLHAALVREARPILLTLLGGVVLVLLIACMNVANLLLARASDRESEMAVRAALGAGRPRLVRQVLTESGLLAVAGSVTGVFLAVWGIEALAALGPEAISHGFDVGIDGGVLGAAILAGASSAILFGLAPAVLMARRDGQSALRAAGQRGGGARRVTVRRALAVSQVGLSFVLLVGAGIILRSAVNLARVNPGFEPEGLHTFTVTLPGGSIGGPGARAAYMNRVENEIRDLPGVTAVGLTGGLPLGGVDFRQPYGPEGSPPEEWSRNEANFRVVTAEYFDAMGTRVLAGRAFTPIENVEENERVVIVSAGLATRLAPDGNAVGQTIGFPLDGDPVFATIVGVVEDVRFDDLRRPGGETIYVPYRQEASRTVSIAVRTRGPSTGLPERIRAIVGAIPTDVPIPAYDFRDMRTYVDRALGPTRFALALVAAFAGLALVLAVVGLAGLMSYIVSRRTREFGIRIAVGAEPRALLAQVLWSGVALAGVGLAVGCAIALASSSALRAIAFEVARADPLTYALSALTLLAATLAASWWPARRAAAVEPLAALRVE